MTDKPGITVYGNSENTIKVEGRLEAEFMVMDHPWEEDGPPLGDLVGFSDGTILRIELARGGVWRISPVVRGPALLGIEQCSEEGDDSSPTDRAHLSAVEWVIHGMDYAVNGHVA